MRTIFLLAGFAVLGCDHTVRCRGDVPEGHLELLLGQGRCVGGVGYRCTGPNIVEEDPQLCRSTAADVSAHLDSAVLDSGIRSDAGPRG